jgi:hypothetical protein
MPRRIFGLKEPESSITLRMSHTGSGLHILKSSSKNVDQIKESEVGGKCLQMVEMYAISELLNSRGRLHVEDDLVDEKLIFKWSLIK